MLGPTIIPASPAMCNFEITLQPLPLITSPTMLAGEFERKARQFLDAISEAFEKDFKLSPSELRQKSLLGSGTFFRVLAGVWFELTSTTDANGKQIKAKMSGADALNFLKKLAPHTGIPLSIESGWLTTGAFPSPNKGVVVTAPSSRNQDLKLLTTEITHWAIDPSSFPFGK
jgi:hypothetical protein